MLSPRTVKIFTARRLYVTEFMPLNEIAEMVGITRVTLRSWIDKNNWEAEQQRYMEETLGGYKQLSHAVLLEDLKFYLSKAAPALYLEIKPAIDNYITLIENYDEHQQITNQTN